MKSINVEGGFFCGGLNFSKSVSVGPMFIREMRVDISNEQKFELSECTALTAVQPTNKFT